MPLSDENRDRITQSIFAGRKIEAIKIYREGTGAGLKESKDFIESLTRTLREEYPDRVPESKSGCGPAMVLCMAVIVVTCYRCLC